MKIEKIEKHFFKWENIISNSIADKDKRTQAVESVNRLKDVYLRNYKIIQDELLNDESIMNRYNASEAELDALQKKLIALITDVYNTDVSTHLELIELSTPEEWKKIK